MQGVLGFVGDSSSFFLSYVLHPRILCVSRLRIAILGVLGFLGVLMLIFVFFRLSCPEIQTLVSIGWFISNLVFRISGRAFGCLHCSPADLKARAKEDMLSIYTGAIFFTTEVAVYSLFVEGEKTRGVRMILRSAQVGRQARGNLSPSGHTRPRRARPDGTRRAEGT